ncbi:hypothetical protein O9993_12585 [Vibrio lentus]|nr:hypothetical protein [Vibrio lentus]
MVLRLNQELIGCENDATKPRLMTTSCYWRRSTQRQADGSFVPPRAQAAQHQMASCAFRQHCF